MKHLTILAFAFLFVLHTSCSSRKCVESSLKPDCVCTMDYDPVCGCNGKTYPNACAAKCRGINKYTAGECK